MGTVGKIAFRNLKEHKAKSLIVGILIATGVMVMVLSNSILDSAEKGSEKVFIDNYTAHLLVSKKIEKGAMTAFGVEGNGFQLQGPSVSPIIPEYSKVFEYLNTLPEAVAVNSQTAGMSAFIKFGEGMEEGAFTMHWGIDPDTYLNMFPDNIEIIDGEFLESNKQGVMLNEKVINDIKEKLDRDVKVGDIITFQSFYNGLKIHEVPLKGIFKYKRGNAAVIQMNLIDIESYRILAKMTVGTTDSIDLEDSDMEFLDSEFDFDSMFSDDIEETVADESVDYDSVLGDLSVREVLTKPSSGTWNFSLVKLKSLSQVDKVKKDIDDWALENNIPLEVTTWEDSAGSTGETVSYLRTVFNIFIIIVAVVTIIIIMNTLVVSIMERTSEIGTMRAVGANKSFVRKLFVAETLTISMVFGCIGIIVALIIILILNRVGLSFNGNLFLEAVFAGESLRPITSFMSIFKGLIISFGIGLFSSFYPVSVALKIDPIKAIQS